MSEYGLGPFSDSHTGCEPVDFPHGHIAFPDPHVARIARRMGAEFVPHNYDDPPTVSDHAEAAAEYLDRCAKLIRGGKSVEDLALEMLPVVRIMARRT